MSSILLGSEDVTGRDVTLTADSPPIRIVFRSNGARVSGSVENGAGAQVVLVEADQDHYIPGESLRYAVCDGKGRFTLEDVRPTAYFAFAFPFAINVSSGDIMDAVYLKGLGRQAQTVHLSEGETATLNLKTTPWPE